MILSGNKSILDQSMRTALLILSWTIFSAPALGACLTAKDVKQGVTLIREKPYFNTFYDRAGAGLTEQRLMDRNGSLEPISAEYRHPLLVTKRIGSGRPIELSYSNAGTLDDLPERGKWQSDATLFINQEKVAVGTETITFRKWTVEKIGRCSYKVWEVTQRLDMPQLPPTIFRQYYSPELDLVLRSIRLDANDKPISEVRFDRLHIGKAK